MTELVDGYCPVHGCEKVIVPSPIDNKGLICLVCQAEERKKERLIRYGIIPKD